MTATRRLLNERYGRDTGPDDIAPAGETLAGLLSRRCIRRYTDAPVSEELLDVLLACAQSAPTKSNLQQYSIVVTAEHDRLMRLAEICPDTGHLRYCPVFLTFCADMRRMQRIAEFRGHEFSNNSMDGFLNAVVDAAMAMQCFVTAAEAAGLGCAPISDVRNRIEEFSEALALPNGVFPVAGLTLGWPAWDGRMNARLPAEVVVHHEEYDDRGLEAAIEAYDAQRHAAAPIAPANQRHTNRYGVSDSCTWSENAARQLSVAERPGFAEFLRNRGFELS